jgi:hypothetical protein
MTSTSFDTISALTREAHLPNHPFVASHVIPAIATGPNTTATRSKAFRMRRENHTIAAAEIARPAKKIVMIAPTPGAATLIPVSPADMSNTWFPIVDMLLPVA